MTGTAVLRARPESRGGPFLEFPCPGCRAVLHLIPHGHARYAEPGEPPPPVPDTRERRVPWSHDDLDPAEAPAVPAASREPTAGPPPRAPAAAPPPPASRRPTGSPPAGAAPAPTLVPDVAEGPLTRAAAERLLRLLPGYSTTEVERAFRRRALQCHPDKVAHLDEDFQALAAKKFKRLKEARDLLAGGSIGAGGGPSAPG